MKKLIIYAVFVTVSLATLGQVVVSDSVLFEKGKSKMSETVIKTLDKIVTMVVNMEYFDIDVTAYLEKPSAGKDQQTLAMKRMKEICNFLIRQNLGTHIRRMTIVSVESSKKNGQPGGLYENRVDLTIRELIPEPREEGNHQDGTLLPFEPDSVITARSGTQVIIQGGSFFPSKISDYRYEIKELTTADEFIHHNVSTLTAEQQVIQNARAIRILAIPKQAGSAVPVKLQKPAVILFPCPDSSRNGPLTLFYQAKDQKSFITWKKTCDTTSIQQYGGKTFYRIIVKQLGWTMVGEYYDSCHCSISLPRFREQELCVSYPDSGSVIMFEHTGDKIINLPCAAGRRGMVVSGMAFDQSGQIYYLDMTFSVPEPKKENIMIYKIRKKDYVKFNGHE